MRVIVEAVVLQQQAAVNAEADLPIKGEVLPTRKDRKGLYK